MLVMRQAKLASSRLRLSPVRLTPCARRLLAGCTQQDVWL
ncbi:hypothetical protein J3D56_003436 [Erwinia persicina]|nr:hypothetical protein [Erwinia persicina]